MPLQELAICFDCTEPIHSNPVYEAACGHSCCPSMVFHGTCLMRWRELREEAERRLTEWLAEHSEYDPRYRN